MLEVLGRAAKVVGEVLEAGGGADDSVPSAPHFLGKDGPQLERGYGSFIKQVAANSGEWGHRLDCTSYLFALVCALSAPFHAAMDALLGDLPGVLRIIHCGQKGWLRALDKCNDDEEGYGNMYHPESACLKDLLRVSVIVSSLRAIPGVVGALKKQCQVLEVPSTPPSPLPHHPHHRHPSLCFARYLRALSDLGLLKDTRYMTGISGGSWASGVYT